MASPIYPGYYPGKPLYKDRRYIPKAEEVKLNAAEEFLSRLYMQQSIPRWVYEQELKTIRESLVIESEDPAKFSPADVVGLGEEDLQEQPGAKVRISLDPADWKENIGKEFIEEFLVKPIASITDWDEYRVAAKGKAWNDIINGLDDGFWGAEGNPYKLYNESGPEDPRERFYGVPGETPKEVINPSKAAVAYMQNSASTKTRNSRYHAFVTSSIGAWAGEFNSLDPIILAPQDRQRFEDVRESLNRTYGALEGLDGLWKVSGGLVKDSDKKLTFSISDLGEHFDKDTQRTYTNRSEFDTAFKNAKVKVGRLTTQKELEVGKDAINLINHIESNLYDQNGNLVASDDKIYTFMKIQLSRMHNTQLDGGVIAGMSKKSMVSLVGDEGFVATLKSTYVDPATGEVKDFTSKSSKNLYRLNGLVRSDWEWEALGDALTDLSEGKIPYQIVWQRFVLPRVERYTPSFWIKRGIGKAIEKTGLITVVEKYQAFFGKIQDRAIGKVFLFIQNPKERFKARLVALITNAIAGAVAVGTGGIGWFVTQAVKVAARFTVNKVSKFVADTWKKIKQGEGWDFMADSITHVMKIIGVILLGGVISILAFLLFISMILTAFGVEDATKIAVDISGREHELPEGLPAFGGYSKSTCRFTEDILDLTFPNNSPSGPARFAYDLVTDLMRGFWCYWNHQPDYDSASDPKDLFDEIRFAADPFPGSLNSCADCLFWCTWLPYIAYGNAFDQNISYLSAQGMTDFFQRQQTFINPNIPGAASRIRPGDIVFFQTGSGGWHVAMVYYVNSDVVMTIHSNAPYKELGLTVSTSGTVQSPSNEFGAYLTIVGFGRPR